MERKKIYEGVEEVLVGALGVERENVTDGARIVYDLEAESIDYLDIVYRLERKFGIRVQNSELFVDSWQGRINPNYLTENGRGFLVNEAGLVNLSESYPHLDFAEFRKNPDAGKLEELQTVDSLVRGVEKKLREKYE